MSLYNIILVISIDKLDLCLENYFLLRSLLESRA